MKTVKKLICILSLAFCLASSAAPSLISNNIVSEASAKTYNSTTIANVQKKLNKRGYNCGSTDGAVGKRTKAAIKSFQKKKGLKVTGAINKPLLKALNVKETVPSKSSNSNEYIVYVTDTGEKYHRSGCRYLSRSRHPIPLSSARYTYEPCSVCRP